MNKIHINKNKEIETKKEPDRNNRNSGAQKFTR